MPGFKSNYLRLEILDHILGGADYTRPATVWIALYTVAPTASTAGTEVSTSGTGYARFSVTNNNTNWPAAASSLKKNAIAFDFGTATGSWGTVVAAQIMDASTAGNALYGGPLNTPKTINVDDSFRIPIDAFQITEG